MLIPLTARYGKIYHFISTKPAQWMVYVRSIVRWISIPGHLSKNVRRKSVSPAEVRLAGKLSANYGFTLRLARFALSTARSLAAITSAASVRQSPVGSIKKTQGLFPVWNQQMTAAASTARSDGANEPVDYLLFGSCVTGVFGDSGEDKDSVFCGWRQKPV
jgi:hypothetical protein